MIFICQFLLTYKFIKDRMTLADLQMLWVASPTLKLIFAIWKWLAKIVKKVLIESYHLMFKKVNYNWLFTGIGV